MTAKEVLEYLNIYTWLRGLCLKEFPFIAKMSTPPVASLYKEVTVRIPSEEKTKFGKDKPQRRRFDAVLLVKPHYKAWGDEIFTVGIEIKVSKSDLIGDGKYLEYLGYTDFFFLCVPKLLLEEAQAKIGDNPLIGLMIIELDNCQIVGYPERQVLSPLCSMQLYRELTLKNL